MILLGSSPLWAQGSAYVPWQGQAQTGDTQDLLKNLRAMIAEAAQTNAADATFLDDLRRLADAYDNQWPVRLLYDDFRDGDFTRNPTWTVSAGTWRVDTRNRFTGLRSTIYTSSQTDTGNAPSDSNGQQLVAGLLGALLNQQNGQGQQRPEDQYALIYTPVVITNSFAARIEIASRDEGGRFDFGPYVGDKGNTSYLLSYVSTAQNGLVLSRVTSQGTTPIASSNGPIALEDNRSHTIDWRRDRNGKMIVALDGKTVIEAVDRAIRRPFAGFMLINSGGTYWIHSVAVNGVR